MSRDTDQRRSSPAAQRNAGPLLAVLRQVLPPSGTVLEIASGTGEHAVHFARALPGLRWQPSDPSADARASIAAWAAAERLPNLLPPLALDAAAEDWLDGPVAAILCVNMVHISPWAATEGLMRGAARLLPAGGPLILYGPYRRDGVPTAASNEAFDADLRRRDARWGLRRLEDVVTLAGEHGLTLSRVVEMPANNLTVVLHRRPDGETGSALPVS
ncbi:DUF938 domain-containing protein [Sphingomonas jatrophae]|uniref:SAM-dependent methyltransferase n=1 Tax=Sphingomonas jatrophae TaxID=1166337 RepID=A0A1I6M7W2_9SPHN|nr:DUF938 domain-containing protein [Sphingomonas jatrophae]SFS11810.1 Protein of unknown function [Sphingomonas jatrophae]